MTEPSDSIPPSEPPKPDKHKRMAGAVEKAKGIAIPSSIIGAIVTAITAMVQANDTSLEKKTYETLVTMVQDDREAIKSLRQHIDTIEQALITAALRPHAPVVAQEMPEPEAAPAPEEGAPAEEAMPAATAGRWHARVRGSKGGSMPVSAEQVAVAEEIANSLGRTLAQDGETVVVEQEKVEQAEALPEFDELKE